MPMNITTAPPQPGLAPLAEQAPHNLLAVSLQDYEQVVTARASFLDFLLARTEGQE
jgi:hypothetical protein